MPALRFRDANSVPATAALRPVLQPVDAAFVLPDGAAAATSPALALQRQLGQAVLRGWCEPRVTTSSRLRPRQIAIVVGCATLSWSALFGAGWTLLA